MGIGVCSLVAVACLMAEHEVPAVSKPSSSPSGRIEDVWEEVSLRGVPVGYSHTIVERKEHPQTRLITTTSLRLSFRRQRALIRLRVDQSSVETPRGKVLGVGMRQFHPGGRELVLAGLVRGDQLEVIVDTGKRPSADPSEETVLRRIIPWHEEVVGLHGLEQQFQRRKPEPGERWELLRYEPTFNTVITVRVSVAGSEEVRLPEGTQKLLRVEMKPIPIEVPGHRIDLPEEVWWLDSEFRPVRRRRELEGLGTLLFTRARESLAGKTYTGSVSAGGSKLVDVGLDALIPLNRAISRPHFTPSARYRVHLRGGLKASRSLFAEDGHQEVRVLGEDALEIHVHPVRRDSRTAPSAARPGVEFLSSSPYITVDESIKNLARRAVGTETRTWEKGVRLERWLHTHMRPDQSSDILPAGEVARRLRGDCRAYAILLAALCRAEGIPSRVAVGLVYVEKNRRPFLGFHMWTEVFVDERWMGLDATLGLGGIGAGHLKIADHSWHNTYSLTPLLPVRRLLGKMSIEVVDTSSR
jgi:hypothetical protein